MESKVVSEVNELFEVLNERIRGYEKAREKVNNLEYRTLFQQYVEQSKRFENELRPFSDRSPEQAGTRMQGDLWHFWMDIKGALTSDSDESMIKACIGGEEAAIDKYREVLNDDDLPINLRSKISEQLTEIRAAHGNLSRLKEIE